MERRTQPVMCDMRRSYTVLVNNLTSTVGYQQCRNEASAVIPLPISNYDGSGYVGTVLLNVCEGCLQGISGLH